MMKFKKISLESFSLEKIDKEPSFILENLAERIGKRYLEVSQMYFGVLTYMGKDPNKCLGEINEEALKKTEGFFLNNHKDPNKRYLPQVINQYLDKN